MQHAPILPAEGASGPLPVSSAPAVMALLNRLNRHELGHTIEVLVALLDVWDDPDAEEDDPLEANGDELDGAPAEDEFMAHRGSGPGCLIADPDAAVDDKGCDDINDDREEEASVWPAYGVDQTMGPLPPGHL